MIKFREKHGWVFQILEGSKDDDKVYWMLKNQGMTKEAKVEYYVILIPIYKLIE